jgi:hypothetical protein
VRDVLAKPLGMLTPRLVDATQDPVDIPSSNLYSVAGPVKGDCERMLPRTTKPVIVSENFRLS